MKMGGFWLRNLGTNGGVYAPLDAPFLELIKRWRWRWWRRWSCEINEIVQNNLKHISATDCDEPRNKPSENMRIFHNFDVLWLNPPQLRQTDIFWRISPSKTNLPLFEGCLRYALSKICLTYQNIREINDGLLIRPKILSKYFILFLVVCVCDSLETYTKKHI